MTKEIMQKTIKIVEIAMMLNSEPTQKEISGNKPTIFVEFMGHIGGVTVTIHSNGWQSDECSDYSWFITFDKEKRAVYVDGEVLGIKSNYNISVSNIAIACKSKQHQTCGKLFFYSNTVTEEYVKDFCNKKLYKNL